MRRKINILSLGIMLSCLAYSGTGKSSAQESPSPLSVVNSPGGAGIALTSPLEGVTVVDLTRVLSGPYCTMMLADAGARVIKIESPWGDDSRFFGPFHTLGGKPGRSLYFDLLNRGKESISLNLKKLEDKKVFLDILKQADVLVENFRPGVMEKLGLGFQDLIKINPDLIYAKISGFGPKGPIQGRAGYDTVIQAKSGLMSINGFRESDPVLVGTSISDITTGMYAYAGILTALFARERGQGTPMKVNMAMINGTFSLLHDQVAEYVSDPRKTPGRTGNDVSGIAPFGVFQAKNRKLIIAAGNDALFQKLIVAMEIPELGDDVRFKENKLRVENLGALKIALENKLINKDAEEWEEILNSAGVPSSTIDTVNEAIRSPQIEKNNMIIHSVPHGLPMIGTPIKIEPFEDPETRKLAPLLNQDDERIRREFSTQ